METLCFVGTYSQRGSVGIYSCALNAKTGALRVLDTAPAQNATFLALTPDGKTLLASLEVGEVNGEKGGAVAAFRVMKNGELIPLATANVRGVYPCHVTVSPNGNWTATSQYAGGTHSVLPLGKDGKPGAVAGFVTNTGKPGPKDAQKDGAHAHSAHFSSDGRYLVSCDLGLDQLTVYAFDNGKGTLIVRSEAHLPPGSGPRHFVWSPTIKTVAYVINEHGSSISRLLWDVGKGMLAVAETVPTLPGDLQKAAEAGKYRNQCADIHATPDGRFVYGSNRGHDSLAVFAADAKTGKLNPVGHVPCGGKEPRNFALVPKSDLLLCAHQNSDTIAAFRLGREGLLTPTGAICRAIPAPVCVIPTATAL